MRSQFLKCCLFFVGATSLWSQTIVPPPGYDEFVQLMNGMTALRKTVELDRQKYLPGETICVKITISNPTAKPIRSVPPFRDSERYIALLALDDNGVPKLEVSNRDNWIFELPRSNMMDGVKLVSIGPGEVLSANVCMIESPNDQPPIIDHAIIGTLPPGKYRITYSFSDAPDVDFEVVKVTADSLVQLALPQYKPNPKTGVPEGCLGIRVAALQTQDYTVVAEVHPAYVCESHDTGRDLLQSFTRYVRLAESDGVNGLAVTKREDGDIMISWTDNRGARHQRIIKRQEQ